MVLEIGRVLLWTLVSLYHKNSLENRFNIALIFVHFSIVSWKIPNVYCLKLSRQILQSGSDWIFGSQNLKPINSSEKNYFSIDSENERDRSRIPDGARNS